MADQKLDWQWDGQWSTSGNGVWTACMAELESFDSAGALPGTDLQWRAGFPSPWADFRWKEVRDETPGPDLDCWEWEHPNGTRYVIFND